MSDKSSARISRLAYRTICARQCVPDFVYTVTGVLKQAPVGTVRSRWMKPRVSYRRAAAGRMNRTTGRTANTGSTTMHKNMGGLE